MLKMRLNELFEGVRWKLVKRSQGVKIRRPSKLVPLWGLTSKPVRHQRRIERLGDHQRQDRVAEKLCLREGSSQGDPRIQAFRGNVGGHERRMPQWNLRLCIFRIGKAPAVIRMALLTTVLRGGKSRRRRHVLSLRKQRIRSGKHDTRRRTPVEQDKTFFVFLQEAQVAGFF